MTPLVAMLLALAVYRATVLVTKDYICEPLRSLLLRWAPPEMEADFYEWRDWWALPAWRRSIGRHLAYLSGCPWCCSIWAAAVLVPLTALVSWFVWVDAGLASSAVAGVIFTRVNEAEEAE